MRKTTIGCLALLVIGTALFAAPALSTSGRQEVTVQSLARQVRVLRNEVRGLRAQVKIARKKAAHAEQGLGNVSGRVDEANRKSLAAMNVANRLNECLGSSLPLTRYGDFLGTAAPEIFTVFDADVQGQVPVIRSAHTFGATTGVDITAAGDPVGLYVAVVEPSCASGFRIAARQAVVAR